MPLTYLSLIAMAYLSPNAEIIGGIKLNLWHYPAISDFEGFLLNLTLLFAIDLMSFVINAFLLWKFCNLNIIKGLQKIQNELWFFMAVVESTLFLEVKSTLSNHVVQNITFIMILKVFLALVPGSGMDLTLQFAWKNGPMAMGNGTMN